MALLFRAALAASQRVQARTIALLEQIPNYTHKLAARRADPRAVERAARAAAGAEQAALRPAALADWALAMQRAAREAWAEGARAAAGAAA